jgi:PKHD-type hydroxylase
MVTNTYWLWESALSEDFCNYVFRSVNWDDAQDAKIGMENKSVVNADIRRTDVVWQDIMQPLGCVLQTYIHSANQQAEWEYPLTGFEKTQIGRYKAEDKGYYDWHMDSGPPENGIQRKLSCVILLNDASEFEGGILQFKGMEDRDVLTKRGSVIVFPSFIEHKVTPVTAGIRYSAVAWASGPTFR